MAERITVEDHIFAQKQIEKFETQLTEDIELITRRILKIKGLNCVKIEVNLLNIYVFDLVIYIDYFSVHEETVKNLFDGIMEAHTKMSGTHNSVCRYIVKDYEKILPMIEMDDTEFEVWYRLNY